MMKKIKKLMSALLISLGLISLLLVFLLYSTSGLHVLIKLASCSLPGTIKVSSLEGSALKQFSAKEITYQLDDTHLLIKNFNLNWDLSELFRKKIKINRLTADSLELVPDHTVLAHEIQLIGQIDQEKLELHSLQFKYEEQSISSVFQIGMSEPYPLSGTVKLNPKSSDSNLRASLSVAGVLNEFHWTGATQGFAQINLEGGLKDLSQIKQVIKWSDVSSHQNEDLNIHSPEGSIELTGTLPHLEVKAHTQIGWLPHEYWQLSTQIAGTFPWQWQIEASATPPTTQVEGLYTAFKLKGALEASNKGRLNFLINPGMYKSSQHSSLPSLKIEGGAVDFLLTPEQLKGKGTVGLDLYKKINLNLNLPHFDLAKGLMPEQKIDAQLDFNLSSLDFLKEFSPEIANPQGQLNAALQLTGTWAQKQIKSSLKLSQGAVSFPSLGLHLKAIELLAKINKNQWQAQGTLNSEQSQLALEGKGIINPSLGGDIAVNAKDFPIMNTKEYQILISPQLKININSSALNISGEVLVPAAQIRPQSFTNSLTLPEDVVFKSPNQSQNSPSLLNTQVKVQVSMGDKVELQVKGLHALLGGTVTLNQPPQGQLNAVGELMVKKGEYKAYGQNLDIEQGQLIFTGGRVDNPGINLKASKKINTTVASNDQNNKAFDFNNAELQTANVTGNIKVGVEVVGHLNKPKITLFSNPALLSQADILSMLILGVPAKQANKAGGQLLLAAISSMNLGGGTNGTQLLEQLKKNMGFDLNLQTNSNYNVATNQTNDSTSVVVGKSLSKKIYVSYNVGLSQTNPNVLTLKYLLNKFYSVQVSNSTTSSAIDILFTSSHK